MVQQQFLLLKSSKNYFKFFFRLIKRNIITYPIEHENILNMLNEAGNSKFVTRKWNIVNDQSNAICDVGNEIIYNTEVLKSSLCDDHDAYILERGNITIAGNIVGRVPPRI